MKPDWEVKKLTDIAKVKTGKWDANHANTNGAYLFYTCAYTQSKCDTKRFSGECIILPGNGVNVGEVFYYSGDFDAYQRTYVLSEIQIMPRYLYYHMIFNWKDIGVKKQYGSATNFIKIGNFHDYKVSYPSFPEQKQIVEILDKVFALIDRAKANTEKNLQNARELFQSELDRIFTQKGDDWEEKKLGEVCDVIAGQSPESSCYNAIGQGLPFYQGKKEFREKYINKPKVWTTKVTKEAEANDILISVRAPVGPINISTQKICIGRGLAAIRSGKLLDNDYLYYYLYTKQDKIKGSSGMVFDSISKGHIENFNIPMQPLTEQKRIVAKLDALSTETQKLEAIYQSKLSYLEELKKSILDKAFRGELTE